MERQKIGENTAEPEVELALDQSRGADESVSESRAMGLRDGVGSASMESRSERFKWSCPKGPCRAHIPWKEASLVRASAELLSVLMHAT